MNQTDPHSDAWGMPAEPTGHPPVTGKKARIPWDDGRIYRHTDGTPCGAGQNQMGLTYEGDWPNEREVKICLTHSEEVVLAARYRHEEDGEDCDADEGQVTRYPGEASLCTLHELPVEKVW